VGWRFVRNERKAIGLFCLAGIISKRKKALHTINIYKNRPSENEK